MPPKKTKLFVLDTNVILHNYRCIYSFDEHDVVIPIVVLEELDNFKKGNEEINYHAREFTRELDKIAGDALFEKGVKLGTKLGKLFIETGKPFSDVMNESFSEKTPDHKILSITEYLTHKQSPRAVVLVTKDINLRMKAKSLGLIAEDYKNDQVQDISDFYKDTTTIDNFDDEKIKQLYANYEGIDVPKKEFKQPLKGHHFFILKGNHSSALARYNPVLRKIQRVEKLNSFGIEPRNAEQAFALSALTNTDVKLVSLTGKAGTGKTLLALASALEQHKKYDQILLARPIVALASKDLGFLPGDVKDKIGPYMQPLFDNLAVIKNQLGQSRSEVSKIEEMLQKEKLMITPLAYIRGRSLSNVFFIIDEAQNLTPLEVKTIITRAGEGTKIVFTGDIQQIDSPYLDSKSNGITYLTDRMNGQELFAHVNMVKGERSLLAELASELL
ncbi:MAG: PhoH family protein [Bacteroidales bacterium]|nr:PhoH family protein [Bacteroidales bacterium]